MNVGSVGKEFARSIGCLCTLMIFSSVVRAGAQGLTINPDTIVTNATQTPQEGKGHNYIHDLSETVNPQNGQLSVRISAPGVPDRGSNHPRFVYMYDTSGRLSMSGSASLYGCVTSYVGVTTCQAYVGFGGFTASTSPIFGTGFPFPLASIGQIQTKQRTDSFDPTFGQEQSGGNNSNQDYYCNHFSVDTFIDFNGGVHSLNMQYTEPLQSGQGHDGCNLIWNIVPSYGGGDSTYKAICTGSAVSTCTPAVSDSHGSEFTRTWTAGPSVEPLVVDTNGNGANGSGRTWSYTTAYVPNAISPILGSGVAQAQNLQVPSEVTVPGVEGAFTYHYSTFTRGSSTGLSTQVVNTSTSSGVCSATSHTETDQSTSFLEVSSISLPPSATYPDGLSYVFGYDSAWGLLNSITYPNGEKITYTWTKTPSAEYANVVSPPAWKSFGFLGTNPGANCYFNQDIPQISKRVVSFDGVTPALEQDFYYQTLPSTNGFWQSKQTKVITTDLLRPDSPKSIVVYNYLPIYPAQPPWEIAQSIMAVEDSILYEDGAGNVLQTVKKVWSGPDTLSAECTILGDGSVSGKFYQYLQGYNSPYHLTDVVTDMAEYGYEQGLASSCVKPGSNVVPDKETAIVYASVPNTAEWSPGTGNTYYGDYISSIRETIDRPSSIIVYDHGSKVSETDVQYDGSNVASLLVPAYEHDGTNFGTQFVSGRGNATTITHKCLQNCQDAIWALTYDEAGQVQSIIDPVGNTPGMTPSAHQTTFSYADAFSEGGQPPNNPATGQPWGTDTYVSNITRPSTNGVAHTGSFSYNYEFGELTKSTDENGKISTFAYNDTWGRPTLATMPDQGSVSITYDDEGENPSVTTGTLLNASTGAQETNEVIEDGAGHAIKSLKSAPGGSVEIDTQYDGNGRVFSVSNPFVSSPGANTSTTYAYDALGRKIYQCNQDNGSNTGPCVSGSPNGSSYEQWSYAGPIVTFVDENGSQWQKYYDSFGRLGWVKEPNGTSTAAAMLTNYSYDALGNLLSVTQSGISGDSARNRTFTYNSLSRLICASNPETTTSSCPTSSTGNYVMGTTGFSYDANGNVASKTDARGVTVNYIYDALNRPTSKTYTNAPLGTLSSCFWYDSAANGVGRLSAEWTQSGSCPSAYPPASYQSKTEFGAYDAVGRVVAENQCVLGFCTSATPPSVPTANCTSLTSSAGLQFCYDLVGNLTAYSNGLTAASFPQQAIRFSQQFDVAGRLSAVSSSWSDPTHPGNVFSVDSTQGYTPFNALQKWYLGPSLTGTRTYDNRLRVTSGTVSVPQ